MAFLIELLTSMFWFIIYAGCALLGVFVGKKVRDNKTAKQKKEPEQA